MVGLHYLWDQRARGDSISWEPLGPPSSLSPVHRCSENLPDSSFNQTTETEGDILHSGLDSGSVQTLGETVDQFLRGDSRLMTLTS